jgi:hypothetical protein
VTFPLTLGHLRAGFRKALSSERVPVRALLCAPTMMSPSVMARVPLFTMLIGTGLEFAERRT